MKLLPLTLLFTTLATGCASYRQQVREARRQQVQEARIPASPSPPQNNLYASGRETVEWLRQEGYLIPGGPCATLMRFPENNKSQLKFCVSRSKDKKGFQGRVLLYFP